MASFRVAIISFGGAATEALFHGGSRSRRFPADMRRTAIRKLDMLNAATDLRDLTAPPGNRLEVLRGDLRGYHSVRINDQWRVVFRWTPEGPAEVSIVDYHS